MNLMIVPGMFVCSSFLISVCMFIVAKALLISSATVIVRAGVAICKEEGSSPVSLQLLRGGIWACMRSVSLLGFGIGTMLANFHV